MSSEIARLQAEQKAVREQRKRVAQELRNAQKWKQILKHRARLLSSDDLCAVIAMRETEAAQRLAQDRNTGSPPEAAPVVEPVATNTGTEDDVKEKNEASEQPPGEE